MVESLSTTTAALISEEEYFLQAQKSIDKLEYYNGKIIKVAGGTSNHNLTATNISTLLNNELWQKETNYFVLNSDQRIAIPKLNAYIYPDAVVVCETLEYHQNRKDTIVNPLLIVEVTSSTTARADRTTKFEKYRTLNSFKEYVLVEQSHPQVLSRYKSKPNTWVENEVNNIDETIVLPSINIKLKLKQIYRGIKFDDE